MKVRKFLAALFFAAAIFCTGMMFGASYTIESVKADVDLDNQEIILTDVFGYQWIHEYK